MYIETARLILRDFTPDDAQDLQDILGDAQTMACCEPAYTREKTENFLKEFCIGRRGAFAAEHRESGRVIGYILLNAVEAGTYEIGWIFNRGYWRQGYAFEACSAAIDFAFGELGANKVFAETVDVVRSVGLMKKLGMRPEGIERSCMRDSNWAELHLYGLLRADWQAHLNPCAPPCGAL